MTDVYRLDVSDKDTLIFIGDLEVTQAGYLLSHCSNCGKSRAIPMEKAFSYIERLRRRGVRDSGDERLIEQVNQEIESLGKNGTSGKLDEMINELLSSLSAKDNNKSSKKL